MSLRFTTPAPLDHVALLQTETKNQAELTFGLSLISLFADAFWIIVIHNGSTIV